MRDLRLYMPFVLAVVIAALLPDMVQTVSFAAAHELAQDTGQDEDTAVTILTVERALEEVHGLRGVLDVEILPDEEDPDLRVLQITYLTAEFNEFAYRSEILDVYLAVGDVIQRKDMEFTYVRLRPAVMDNSIIEVITAPQVHLLAWVDEGTTRTDFLDVLEIEDAAENPHGGEGSGEGQDA